MAKPAASTPPAARAKTDVPLSRFAETPAHTRLGVAVAVGIVVGGFTAVAAPWQVSTLAGWDASAVVMLVWTWRIIWPMNSDETASHALREDPSLPAADAIVMSASIISLLGVALVIVEGKSKGANQGLAVTVAILSVLVSWTVVHTTFTTRYARLYYVDETGGIDFKNDDPPKYSDFAYVAFTLGMTYQVSDTDLQNTRVRSTALRHGLISYVFGAVIIAATINLVSGLSH